ncbi:NADH-quinone oxidoreductase subunit J [Hydrogenophilus thermoluteolus]|uniref:NADH-quinone oxidoreductase subunit J n=1 Tax=Hydrogenophilus thermoluteolus TaxID=297 RepID=A0A2Z6DY47_HYDTE|nr:NADH-quinone oxidoreductase subunit J [Hydrogenophilus thermoluteolus]BBD77436.1 NADH-quinone oxidoreductase subunit J [Hydrogenophilus thermoluteolus]
MDVVSFVFSLFAFFLLLGALGTVFSRNPVAAAMWLVLTFFSAGGVWLLLQAEFLALTLVLVYVGAVMVLFLFVVMMLDLNLAKLREGFWHNAPLALLVGGALAIELYLILTSPAFDRAAAPAVEGSNTKMIGEVLYTVYAYPFEVAAMILVVAMIAAVTLTHRKRTDVRVVKPEEQIAVKASERLKVVSLPAEKE